MRTIRVNKGELVNALVEGRKKHKAEYLQACEGYRDTMRSFLKEQVGHLSEGATIPIIITDMPPKDHTEDYDVALKMLEMSVDSVVELTHEEFRHMVLDDWDWRRHWSALNMKYLTK